ncbi:DUF3526 domain-containing protein [Maribacter flavus]|uniref:DUF3526 domain-containing protein n=1 Tax=Maribacter flavus TaxID=1658664 RepID=A0A5B2TYC8_9FLAO|nr:DUF3526 domain-containing protein [Maribacter flavus]KAA2218670.1 DUF3526 domain-containing protein [Maribacter flavus]
MFKFNFKYELRQLLRSRWIQLLSLLLLLLVGFATYNGLQKVEERNETIAKAFDETRKNDERMLMLLDSLENGQEVSVPTWRYPTNPMEIGNNYPRVAAMPAEDFTFIATGQSDMFTHFKKPEVYGFSFIEDFTEMTSPVQLLFGSFDLAFVIVYLLPLLIIAFSYNVLSAERESGSLRLLASQPIRMETWVLQKLGLRFFWLSIMVIAAMLVTFLALGVNPFSQMNTFLNLIVLTLAYMLFWFALVFVVNLFIGSSAKNAVSLLGLWIVFVLLVPSILNQMGSTLYPMPSRALMINEMRSTQADVLKRVDDILDNFLRDHPEYAVNDTTLQRTYWHNFMVAQKVIREELQPIFDNYDAQLGKQQGWVGTFKWLSPAVVTQEALNQIAGTSSQDYLNYRVQVLDFSHKWRAHFMPFVYNNTSFKKADVANLPQFDYQPRDKSSFASVIILIIAIGVFGLASLIASKRRITYLAH